MSTPSDDIKLELAAPVGFGRLEFAGELRWPKPDFETSVKELSPSSVIPIPGTGRVIHLSDYYSVGTTATFTGAHETVLVIDASMIPGRGRPPGIPEYVTVNLVRVDVPDTTEAEIISHILRVVPLIDRAFKDGQQVFVNCFKGVSRSASLVIGYLMFQGMTFSNAFDCVQRHRSVICPNMGFCLQLEVLPVKAVKRLDEMDAAVAAVRTAVGSCLAVVDIERVAAAAVAIITAEDSVTLFTVACRYSVLKDLVAALGEHYRVESDITREILSVAQSASALRHERLLGDIFFKEANQRDVELTGEQLARDGLARDEAEQRTSVIAAAKLKPKPKRKAPIREVVPGGFPAPIFPRYYFSRAEASIMESNEAAFDIIVPPPSVLGKRPHP